MLNSINIKYWELCHNKNDLGYQKQDDYIARCDICGDSNKNKSLKRLHLYTKSSYDTDMVNCFNCGYHENMYIYLRDYHPDLLNSYRSEMGMSNLNSLTKKEQMLEIKEVVNNKQDVKTFNKPSEFIKAVDSEEALKYLKSRKIDEQDINGYYYSSGMVKVLDKTINLKDYIIKPLLTLDNKWYGFYSRNIHKKVFHTFLHEENTGYKVYNWFFINKKDDVYIFEAIFNLESTNIINSIATMGSDISPDRLNELSSPIFCFDNDETGRIKALKYAELGYKVFLYPKKHPYKDFNDMLKDGYTKEEITEFIKKGVKSSFSAVIELKMEL